MAGFVSGNVQENLDYRNLIREEKERLTFAGCTGHLSVVLCFSNLFWISSKHIFVILFKLKNTLRSVTECATLPLLDPVQASH